MTKNFELSQFGSQLTVDDNTKEISIAPSVSVGGTLTYDDVTNIDSIGLVTARSGVDVTGGEILVGAAFSVGQSGIVTSTKLHLFTGNGTDSGIQIQSGASTRGNIYYDGQQSLMIRGASSPGGGDVATLQFITGATPTPRLSITRDGDIGIGISSPAAKLDVTGNIRLKSDGSAANEARFEINEKYNDSDTDFGIDFKRTYDTGGDDQDAGFIRVSRSGGANNFGMLFGIGNRGSVTEKLRITSGGNIGINSNDPTSYGNSQTTLVIEDDTNPAICISDTGQEKDWWIVGLGDGLGIRYADGGGSGSASNVTSAAFFKNNGDLGLGTGEPDGKLDVRGTIFVGGDGGGRISSSGGSLKLQDGDGRQTIQIDDPGSGSTKSHLFDSSGNFHLDGTSSSNSAISLLDSGFIDASDGINLFNGGFYVRRGFQASQGSTTTLILDLPPTVCGIVIINSVLSYNAAARTHKVLAVATRLANNVGESTLVTQNGSTGGKNQSHSWSYYSPTTSTRLTVTTTDADTNLEAVVISSGGAG